MRDVAIAAYLRPPFSRSKPAKPVGGRLHNLHADEPPACILPEISRRTGLDPERVNLKGAATPIECV